MNENLDPTDENFSPEELDVEKKLRPLSFDDFTGQDQVLENLTNFCSSSKSSRRSFRSYLVSWSSRI